MCKVEYSALFRGLHARIAGSWGSRRLPPQRILVAHAVVLHHKHPWSRGNSSAARSRSTRIEFCSGVVVVVQHLARTRSKPTTRGYDGTDRRELSRVEPMKE